jgi:hypothetical protein
MPRSIGPCWSVFAMRIGWSDGSTHRPAAEASPISTRRCISITGPDTLLLLLHHDG